MPYESTYPVLLIHPQRLCVYEHRYSYHSERNQTLTTAKKTYSGVMTMHAKKRMRRAISLLVNSAITKMEFNPSTEKFFPFKLNFITLTLPAPQGSVSDRDIQRQALNPWLQYMRKYFGLKTYVWRTERQRNGNIHYHITTQTFIPYWKIQEAWNRRMSAMGFIEKFRTKHGHSNPNSTDVHAVRNIRDLEGYLTKYMTKEPERCSAVSYPSKILRLTNGLRPAPGLHRRKQRVNYRECRSCAPVAIESKIADYSNKPIAGKIWDCSVNLKKAPNMSYLVDNDINAIIQRAADDPANRYVRTDHCELVYIEKKNFRRSIGEKLYRDYQGYMRSIREYQSSA